MLNIYLNLVNHYLTLSKPKIDKQSKMAADQVWIEEAQFFDLSEPEEFKIWIDSLEDPICLLNARDHLYRCLNLSHEQPSEGHPKNVKGGET